MTALFAQQLDDARTTEGRRGVARLWIRSLVDLAATAPGEHLAKEVLVASPVGAPDNPTIARRGPLAGVWLAVALLPLWLVIGFAALAPGFTDPLYSNPPDFLGLPVGVVLLGVAWAWMAVGAWLIVRTTALGWRVAALAFCTLPATALVLLSPAIALIIANNEV